MGVKDIEPMSVEQAENPPANVSYITELES